MYTQGERERRQKGLETTSAFYHAFLLCTQGISEHTSLPQICSTPARAYILPLRKVDKAQGNISDIIAFVFS